jgi:hypothetical protein
MAFPALGAAGVSLAMGGGASATVPTANVPPRDAELRPVIALDEEEISDVSLATFYVFDKETTGTSQFGQGVQLAAGCRGAAAEAAEAAQFEAAGAAAARAAGLRSKAAEAFGGEAAEVAAVVVAGRGACRKLLNSGVFHSFTVFGPDLMRIGLAGETCLRRCPRGCAGQICTSSPNGWSKLSEKR